MRFEIKVNQPIDKKEPVLVVLLFTRKDEDYLNGCEDGIYNCCSTFPEDKRALLSVIETSVNACLEEYAKDMEEVIRNIVEKNKPQIDNFMDMCFKNEIIK